MEINHYPKMIPQNMEKENWRDALEEFAAGKLNGEDFERLCEIVQKREVAAHSLGEKATLEKVKKALLISLTNEDGSTDVGMFDILWRDIEAYLIIATPTT